MAILFMDGMDHYGATADLIDKYDAISGSVSYQASSGRFGGGAIQHQGDDLLHHKTIPSSSTVILNFAFKTQAGASFGNDGMIQFINTTTVAFELETNSSGQLVAKRGTTTVATSSLTLDIDQWQYIEMKLVIDNVSGIFIVKVDGEEFINFSGDTLEASLTDVNQIRFFGVSSFFVHLYDDIIIMDGTGSKNNDFIGDTKIETIYPDGDGTTTDFTPTGAGTTNADRVDDGDAGPDDDTTYVESSTVGHIDLYTMDNLATVDINSIIAVQSVAYAKKDDAGARTSRSLVKSGTTTDNGPSQGLGTDYKYFLDVLEDNPDTATAWTETNVNSVEVGHEVLT